MPCYEAQTLRQIAPHCEWTRTLLLIPNLHTRPVLRYAGRVSTKNQSEVPFVRLYMFALAVVVVVVSIPVVLNVAATSAQNGAPQGFHVNSQRLQGTLEKLSEFGRNAGGGEVQVQAIACLNPEIDMRNIPWS